jgi:hypothetical protein
MSKTEIQIAPAAARRLGRETAADPHAQSIEANNGVGHTVAVGLAVNVRYAARLEGELPSATSAIAPLPQFASPPDGLLRRPPCRRADDPPGGGALTARSRSRRG